MSLSSISSSVIGSYGDTGGDVGCVLILALMRLAKWDTLVVTWSMAKRTSFSSLVALTAAQRAVDLEPECSACKRPAHALLSGRLTFPAPQLLSAFGGDENNPGGAS